MLSLPQSQKHALPKFFRSLEDGCTSFPPARNVSDRDTKLLGDLKKRGGALIVYALTDVLESSAWVSKDHLNLLEAPLVSLGRVNLT